MKDIRFEVEYPRVHPIRVISFYIDIFEKPVLGFLQATGFFYFERRLDRWPK